MVLLIQTVKWDINYNLKRNVWIRQKKIIQAPKMLIIKRSAHNYRLRRSRLCAVGELTNCPPGTEAKLINKS